MLKSLFAPISRRGMMGLLARRGRSHSTGGRGNLLRTSGGAPGHRTVTD